MNKLSKFYKVRGVKVKNFTLIKNAKNKGASSALLETCFIDSKNDMNVYAKYKDAICNAIVTGIAEEFGLKKKETKKTVKVGSTVKVALNAVIGGLSSNRGKAVSTYLKSNKWKVTKIQTNKNVKEALLSCNTWIAVKYLTVV